ncbi:MAG: DEAD/DEAH box helicase [bacterium]|nr:DEAD/DEAH box helicase [bacterium]
MQEEAAKDRSNTGFHSFRLVESLQRGIDDAGFTDPRPIQWDTIPAALDGQDVLGLAQTGTGKTCAFAVPIIERILTFPLNGPRVLIIAPTRELVLQIQAELQLLARHTKVRSVAIFGGTSAVPQIRTLRSNPEVIVACPGRLLDLYNQSKINFKNIETLVLDEADHMFDQGFLPDIKRILSKLPENRQNLLFSATMPKQIRHLADNILYKPHVVDLGDSAPAETIEHALCPVAEDRKFDLLEIFLREQGFSTAIVFLRTKARAKRTAIRLQKRGHKAIALQGNMSQSQRVKAMEGFRKGAFEILVATDIAARGIDVADVSQVINYDVPNTPDTYTHRIGRTGRSEQSGRAYTLYAKDDHSQVKAIEKKLGSSLPRIRVAGFGDPESLREGEQRGEAEKRQGAGDTRRRSRGRSHRAGQPDDASRTPRSSRGKKRQRRAKQGGQSSGAGFKKSPGSNPGRGRSSW